MNKKRKHPRKISIFWMVALFIIVGIGIYFFISRFFRPKVYNYKTESELIEDIKNGYLVSDDDNKITIYVKETGIKSHFTITGSFSRDKNVFKTSEERNNKLNKVFSLILTEGKFYDDFQDELKKYNELGEKYNVLISPVVPRPSVWSILLQLLPLLLTVILIYMMYKRMREMGDNSVDFSRTSIRLSKDKTVKFNDVAGCDEEKAELIEVVDFLKNPEKYRKLGARIPKGVMLVGAPGTGKTLLAKAVAGEANVPFFSISGSDFVEMYVGVGALRVRNLFKIARQNAPCIIFIDEIDAVGRQRGAGLGGGHDEREQTLNQLLVAMDGFNPNLGIIVMAATNRPDVLDPALLRPGRFDRRITISLPDVRGREAILKVHARNKKIANDVNFKDIAYRIPGFSGADIENMLNEAALLAARNNRVEILEADIDEGIDRVMMGPAKVSKKYTPSEKIRVAFHEAGHAVIGLVVEDSNVVQKITIIPRGRAGGYNLMLPEEETYFDTKESLTASIVGLLGGRSSEDLVLNSISNGAYSDFEQATKIARAMVTEYGMSDLGTVQYESNGGNVFLGRDYLKEKNFSDQVALEIDQEVRKIIDGCYKEAIKTLKQNLELLFNISKYLLVAETINKGDIEEIFKTGELKSHKQELLKQMERASNLKGDDREKDPIALLQDLEKKHFKDKKSSKKKESSK